MININVIRNAGDKICGVKVLNHGDPVVCSAVSILLLNACNSIEMFTSAEFSVDIAPEGGDAVLTVSRFDDEGKAELLLNSLVLGYKSIEESYKDDIIVYD
ncbi:MAG: ribosomal-processing cysteine protease Prp [Clostridia bacterium]|nr:ribosomal-processing cysteine protease Prp [Clostridia bacterium]